MTNESRPRVAIVGTAFGARIHVPAFRNAGFEIVALVGQDAARTRRRAERLNIPRACTDLDEALELGLDAISIASPPATHAPLALRAMDAGCHVLCEKPFTLDVGEAEGLVDFCAQKDLVGLLGHEFRFAPMQALWTHAIRSGLIGEPVLVLDVSAVSMVRTGRLPGWWRYPDQGGGWLGASGSHQIDKLRAALGEFEDVRAAFPQVLDPPELAEDTFSCMFGLQSGASGVMTRSGAAFGPPYAHSRVLGTKGTLWVEGGTLWCANEHRDAGYVVDLPVDLADSLFVGDGYEPGLAGSHELAPYARLARSFRVLIQGGGHAVGPQPATFRDGLACMHVMDAIRKSANRGGTRTVMSDSHQRLSTR